jgi:hypothetical protein
MVGTAAFLNLQDNSRNGRNPSGDVEKGEFVVAGVVRESDTRRTTAIISPIFIRSS